MRFMGKRQRSSHGEMREPGRHPWNSGKSKNIDRTHGDDALPEKHEDLWNVEKTYEPVLVVVFSKAKKRREA